MKRYYGKIDMIFLKNINYYDGYISTYDKYNYEDLKLKVSYFYLIYFPKLTLIIIKIILKIKILIYYLLVK